MPKDEWRKEDQRTASHGRDVYTGNREWENMYRPDPDPTVILLEESETHFLLKVPYEERERAKRIRPYAWDNQHKCWKYQKTGQNYKALLAEFSSDFASIRGRNSAQAPNPISAVQSPETTSSVTQPKPAQQSPPQNSPPGKEIDALNERIRILEAEVQHFQEEIKFQRDNAEQEARLWYEEQLFAKRQEFDRKEKEFKELEYAFRIQNSPASEKATLLEKLRALAIDLSGDDAAFKQMLQSIDMDSGMTALICARLEKMLQAHAGNERTLVKMIEKTAKQGYLSKEGELLARIIQSVRNEFAGHPDDLDKRMQFAAALIVLFSASRLWPQLPKTT